MPASWFSLEPQKGKGKSRPRQSVFAEAGPQGLQWSQLSRREWAFEVNGPKSALASRWTRPQGPERPYKNDPGRQGYLSDI